jgi:hypothetical protein
MMGLGVYSLMESVYMQSQIWQPSVEMLSNEKSIRPFPLLMSIERVSNGQAI